MRVRDLSRIDGTIRRTRGVPYGGHCGHDDAKRCQSDCEWSGERSEGLSEHTRVYQVPIHNPNASNVSRKRPGAQICMYSRAGSA